MKRVFLSFMLLGLAWAEPNWESKSRWWEELGRADVVYLGEEHDRAQDHQMQLQVLEKLAQERRVVVLAEMFQTPSRQVLKAYTQGVLDDQNLHDLSKWEKRWGHPWTLYLPIWQCCQRYEIPLLPLRNSSESGKLLSRQGRAAFEADEVWALPPEPYEFGPEPESLKEIFEAHAGPVSPEAFQRFLKVQVLWEEFMSAQIREALRLYPGSQVVVLVGKGHLLHGHTLLGRTQRNWPNQLNQQVLLCDPKPSEKEKLKLWWTSAPQALPEAGE